MADRFSPRSSQSPCWLRHLRCFSLIVLVLFTNHHSQIMFFHCFFLNRISLLVLFIAVFKRCNPLSDVRRAASSCDCLSLRFPKLVLVIIAIFRRSCAPDCTGLKPCGLSKVLRRVDSQTCLNSLPNGHALCQASLPLSFSEFFLAILILPCLG